MTSPLMEYLGIAGLDIAWLFIGIFVVLLILLILIIVQFAKYKKLKKKYDKFMKGKDGKSLEKDIIALFEDNKFIKGAVEKYKKDIKILFNNFENAFQKIGIVKYDAFNQMGGQLSFCLALLDENNNGFILNSVHSTEGCYSYTKQIENGLCKISLGQEEEQALEMAMLRQNGGERNEAVQR